MHLRGVCRRALKPQDAWEDPLGKAAAANRTREIRPPLFESLLERIRIALKQLFQYQLPYPFFEHHIAESVNAVFVNVVIVDQVFKRLFHLRRPFEPDPLQVVNLVYIFPPENTKQRAGFFLVGCQPVPDISILMEPSPKNFGLTMFDGRLCNFTFLP